jgi:hypothetical protein
MTENHEPGDGWSNDQPTEMTGGVDTVEFYQRETDGKWAWRYRSANNVDVLATDGGQGYENEEDARSAAGRVTGYASEVKTARRGLRFETVAS